MKERGGYGLPFCVSYVPASLPYPIVPDGKEMAKDGMARLYRPFTIRPCKMISSTN